MQSAETGLHVDSLTARACAQFADSLLPVLPMDRLAVVLLDPERESSRVVFSLGDPHSKGPYLDYSLEAPPMCIPLEGREGELGAVLYRGPTAGSYGPVEDALVRQSANRLAEILENIQLRRRLSRMAEETQALDRIGEAVSAGGPTGRVYRRFAHEISKLLDLRDLSIYVADPQSGRLIRASRFGAGARGGLRELEKNRGLSEIGLPLPESLRQSYIGPDFSGSTGEGWPEWQESSRSQSVLAVPVEYAGAVIGAVVAGSHRGFAYGPENKKLLHRAAALLAAPMAKEALSHRAIPGRVGSELTKEIARTLAAGCNLEDVLPSVASALAKNLSFDSVTLAWTDPNGWEIRTLSAGPGTAVPEAILAPDGSAAIHTQVSFQEQRIGTLELVRKDGGAFTPQEQKMLDYLGLQMAPLVQNARLNELAKRQAYRLSQLQQMGRSLDPLGGSDTVMQEAVDEAALLADAVWAELLLF